MIQLADNDFKDSSSTSLSKISLSPQMLDFSTRRFLLMTRELDLATIGFLRTRAFPCSSYTGLQWERVVALRFLQRAENECEIRDQSNLRPMPILQNCYVRIMKDLRELYLEVEVKVDPVVSFCETV